MKKELPTLNAGALLDDPELGAIETTLKLDSLQMKGLRWSAKVAVKTILPTTYHRYNINLELDERPFLMRIEEVEKSLDETLLKDDQAMRKGTEKKVKELREKLAQTRRDCETFDFAAQVEALKYSGSETILTLLIPDDVIEQFNRQKTRMDLYALKLVPIF